MQNQNLKLYCAMPKWLEDDETKHVFAENEEEAMQLLIDENCGFQASEDGGLEFKLDDGGTVFVNFFEFTIEKCVF